MKEKKFRFFFKNVWRIENLTLIFASAFGKYVSIPGAFFERFFLGESDK